MWAVELQVGKSLAVSARMRIVFIVRKFRKKEKRKVVHKRNFIQKFVNKCD